MCGIAGYFDDSLAAAELREVVGCMTGTLTHRGPDDSGMTEVAVGNSTGVFGHRRLSILDLTSAGQQPMRRGRWTVTYNGEIYNSPDLRGELIDAGCAFSSTCDTEVLCWALEVWGLNKTLERLNGMFAFAATDGDSLYLVRDRLGIKPLYYFHDGDIFAFASELPSLRIAMPGAPEIDDEARDLYFIFGYVPGDKCIYRHCHKLLPGHHAIWSRQAGLKTRRYWSPPLPNTRQDGRYDLDELSALLDDVVRSHLISDRPIGVLLSGGVDSSLVAAKAATQGGHLRTYSIGFTFSEYDESAHARAIAEHLGSEHTELLCTEKEALEIIPELPSIYGEPFADSSAVPTTLVCRLARQHVVAALSGDGGDELTIGYEFYRHAKLYRCLNGLPLGKPLGGALTKAFPPSSRLGKMGITLGLDGLSDLCVYPLGIFNPLFYQQLRGRPFSLVGSHWRSLFEAAKDLPTEAAWAWVDLQHYMVEDILAKVDRASMSVGLEARVPLLDHRFVDAVLALPLSAKACRGVRKIALKRLLGRHLPQRLWNRPKMGFGVPIGKWMNGPLKPLLDDYLSPGRLRAEGLFNVPFVERLLNDHRSGRKDYRNQIWCLLMWEMWRDCS
jgi:asparagine synthase (glutamine-hydrolysing)